MTEIVYERHIKGEWVPVSEEYDTEDDFRIDPENIDAEICRLPRLLIQYGELYAVLRAQMDRKEEYAKLVYATVAAKKRQEAAETGEKITEGSLKEFVTVSDLYQHALADQFFTKKNALLAENWWRSIQKKADLIQALTYRQNSEIKRAAY